LQVKPFTKQTINKQTKTNYLNEQKDVVLAAYSDDVKLAPLIIVCANLKKNITIADKSVEWKHTG